MIFPNFLKNENYARVDPKQVKITLWAFGVTMHRLVLYNTYHRDVIKASRPSIKNWQTPERT